MNNEVKKAQIKAVLFDLDGTIFNTLPLIFETYRYTFEQLKLPQPSDESILSSIGLVITDYLKTQIPDTNLRDKFLDVFRTYQKERQIDGIEVFQEAKRMIEVLYQRKIPMGLVSSRDEPSVYRILSSFDLLKYFPCVVTARDTEKHKPNPEPLQVAHSCLMNLNTKFSMLSAQEIAYIGDAVYDIQAAKEAGMFSVLVSWTQMKKESFNQHKPDFILNCFEDFEFYLSKNL